jgi:hypothetical protein
MDKYNTYKIYRCEHCSKQIRIPEGVNITIDYMDFPCTEVVHAWKRDRKLEKIEAKKLREAFVDLP